MPDSYKNSINLQFIVEFVLTFLSNMIETFDKFVCLLVSYSFRIVLQSSRLFFKIVDSAKGKPKSSSLSYFDVL